MTPQAGDEEVLRLRERIHEIANDVSAVKLAVGAQTVKLGHVETLLTTLVTRDQFYPVKAITYGLAGIILLGVGGALMKLVIAP
jgi:hypothetical protein